MGKMKRGVKAEAQGDFLERQHGVAQQFAGELHADF